MKTPEGWVVGLKQKGLYITRYEVSEIQSDARADLQAENKALRERAESAEASFKERDLQMKAALEETESMFQRTQRAEAENVELREAKEKAEAELKAVADALLATDYQVQGKTYPPNLVERCKLLINERFQLRAKNAKADAACAEMRFYLTRWLADKPLHVDTIQRILYSSNFGQGWCSPEDKAKLEAAAAEMRNFISSLCDLRANPNAWPPTYWASVCARADRLLGLNHCGQHLLDRMKAMEEILKDCQHLRSQVFPLACFPECPACRWEAMKEAAA